LPSLVHKPSQLAAHNALAAVLRKVSLKFSGRNANHLLTWLAAASVLYAKRSKFSQEKLSHFVTEEKTLLVACYKACVSWWAPLTI
jgi:hypothetical protein